MLNSSTTAVGLSGPPHFVDLHVNPGESVSIQLFDGNETVLRGPATVTMISQHSFPPVPMPVQVPPGHMVQQIVDENGTLRHIILSALNNNGTNTSNTTPPAATLVPQQQAYPYCCCCCYCSTSNFFSRDLLSSSLPSPNPLPTPPPPPPPPPPIHHSNLWEMGLTHVDSTRRLPFSRTNSKVNSYNIDMTFPASPTTTIRRRLPNRNYSYTKRSPSTLLQATTTSTTTTTTTSTATINNNTSITTTTITTTTTGTSPTINSHTNSHSNPTVNGVTTKLSSSGVLSIATVTSTLTTATTTTTATSTITTSTTNIPGQNSIRTINGKNQTLTVTVSETGSVSRTGAITFPVTHLRTNGSNVATKLTTSVPELISSTEQSTKHQQQQSTKIECLLFSNSNNSVTSGSYNFNSKHNTVTNSSSSTSSHHHHHHHHHHIFTHGANDKLVDSEKNKSSHHHKDNSSSGVLVNRNTNSTSNGLLIGFPSSPIKNGSLNAKGSTTLSTKTQSSNNSPKNDHVSRKVRRDEKSKEEKESNKSKENTPQRKKSNIINTPNGSNYTLDNEIGKNSSGASSASNSKESSPIKIPLNRLSHCKPLQAPIPAIIPINVTLATGPSTTTVPIISIPVEAASLLKKGCDLGNEEDGKESNNDPVATVSVPESPLRSDNCVVSSTLGLNSSLDSKSRKETKESTLTETDSKTNKSTGRNLSRGQQQSQVSTSLRAMPTSVIVNDVDTKINDENTLVVIENETKENISETRPNEKSSTKLNITKFIDHSEVQENGDKLEEEDDTDTDANDICVKGQDAKKKIDSIDQCDVGQVQQSELQSDENFVVNDDSNVRLADNIDKESLTVKNDIDEDKDIIATSNKESNRSGDAFLEQKSKSDDKIDSQHRSTTRATTCNGYVNNVTAIEAIKEDISDSSATHDKNENGDEKTVNYAEDDHDGDDNEEEDDDSSLRDEKSSKTNGIMIYGGDSGDKPKNSPQRSPKHLLPQIQVFCLTYTSLTATSVKLKWINEQGHHNNHHSHHHTPSSSYGSLISETRHYMVEMMKSNAKNGTVTPTTRIVYQGTQASCRVSHLTPSEQYSFRVRLSENNHQLVSNVLTLVTPEHQPVNKRQRSRAQNSNQQVQLSLESSQKQQHFNQNQEQAAFRQQESLNNKIDGETRIIRSEQKCAIVIISLVSVLAVILACIIHNLLMY
ncbi:uncharacterized protein LOC107361930 [Tetranychus urticae]|uniref:Fibronectin type-III domain-containing protein n=1 Tax=Tetranychus urticae TaxID=32264 RepID=T1K8E2_TETUR|nr:uncharacterized protein LOC107361930 [Tetranychus urticae]